MVVVLRLPPPPTPTGPSPAPDRRTPTPLTLESLCPHAPGQMTLIESLSKVGHYLKDPVQRELGATLLDFVWPHRRRVNFCGIEATGFAWAPQSSPQSCWTLALESCLACAIDPPRATDPSRVPCLAILSALSLPTMPTWPGGYTTEISSSGKEVRSEMMLRREIIDHNWPGWI